MKQALFLLALIYLVLGKGSNSTSTCPGGVPPVNCFVSPCSLPAPDGCVFTKCEDDFCGGCNRHYFDANKTEVCNECAVADCGVQPKLPTILCPDGSTGGLTGKCLRSNGVCGWEIRSCPVSNNTNSSVPTCPDVSNCTLLCPFGYEDNSNNCPLCSCKSRPDCTKIACPAIACVDGTTPSILDGTCCPVCKPNCAVVLCAPATCDANTVPVVPAGQCCPVCLPKPNCTSIVNSIPECKSSTFQCPAGSTLVKKACDCFVCEPSLNCSAVRCANVNCTNGTKKVVDGTSCCPTCAPLPVCNIACIQLTCPDGFTPVKHDLECCPTCDPIDKCATVRCAEPACAPQLRVKRKGECCETCRLCRDGSTPTYEDNANRTRCNTVCDDNDDPTCPAGKFRGKSCDEKVPENESESDSLTVKLCRSSKDCELYDSQTLRLLVANVSKCDAKYVTVEVVANSTNADRCCVEMKIHISKEKSDSSVDVKSTTQKTSSILSQTPGFTVAPQVTTGNAGVVSASAALLVALAALVL